MSKLLKTKIIVLFLLIIAGQYTYAQALLTESFNYISGTSLTNANWTTVLSSGSVNPIKVVEGNLSYPGAIMNGIGNKVYLNNNGQDVYKPFDATRDLIYSSFVVNVTSAAPEGDFFYSMGTSAAPASRVGAKVFIKSNGAGFSFGVLRGTGGKPVYEEKVRPFGTDIMLVLKYVVVEGTNNDMVKLYVNPDLTSEPDAPTVMYNGPLGNDENSLSAIALVQGNEANAPTLYIDGIVVGKNWKKVTSALFDYGDVPKSYEYTKDGIYVPAQHTALPGFMLGKNMPDLELLPLSVLPGEDNNGSNGDGLDEDALSNIQEHSIRKGISYTLSIAVANPSNSRKYLYGWIDFNNDGTFQANEIVDTVRAFNNVGVSVQTLTWSSSKTNEISEDIDKLYMRIRISDRSLFDYTSVGGGGDLIDERSIGNGATSTTNPMDDMNPSNGEVEDYQIRVAKDYDYGDLPESYEKNKDDVYLPAVHAYFEGFSLGKLIDTELKPASVIAPNENNSAGDNAVDLMDEDALTTLVSVSRGMPYSLTIPVSIPNNLDGAKYVYAWLDLNADGKFQIEEVATADISTNIVSNTNVELTWTAVQTRLISENVEKIYLRIRLSHLALADFTTTNTGGPLIDERSVGNGARGPSNSDNAVTITFGEVEDYILNVDRYDFGDAPLSYELNQAGKSRPARNAINPLFTIGNLIDEERIPNSVAPGADNNGENGDGLEEDGLHTIPTVTRSAPFSFSVPVSSNIRGNIIAWIDFNNNGRFDEGEAAYASSLATERGYQAIPIGTSNVRFWFDQVQTSLIPKGVSHLYARIRLTDRAGADRASTANVDERAIADGFDTGEYNYASYGEVEDYRFLVGADLYDFGDAPISYDMDKDGTAHPENYKPARNIPSDALHLGSSYTLELGPHAVAIGDDNNGENGDGRSDDGLSADQLSIRGSGINRFHVNVHNSTGVNALLLAWIDVNNNGRFESDEAAGRVFINSGVNSAELVFTAAQMSRIPADADKLYMRLRLIQAAPGVTIADMTSGANHTVVDELAIADGMRTGDYGLVSLGEVEDYQLTINRDYGDVPDSYESGSPASHSNTNIPDLTIGKTIDFEFKNQAVLPGADNNGEHGDGLDEDGISTPMTITSESEFSLRVPINSAIRGTAYLGGWIDFNGEMVYSMGMKLL